MSEQKETQPYDWLWRAVEKSFDVSRLERTPQNNCEAPR